MKKQAKIITALVIISTMILPFLMSKSFAARPDNTGDYVQLSFGGGATAITDVSNGTEVTITYPNGSVTVTGTGLYGVKEQGLNGQNQMEDKYNVYATGNVNVTATPSGDYTVELWENGNKLQGNTIQYQGLVATNPPTFKSIDAVFNPVGGGGGNPQQGQIGGPNDISLNVEFTGTHVNATINGITFLHDNEDPTYNGVEAGAGTTDANETNTFIFVSAYGEDPIREYTINGVTYREGDNNVVIDEVGGFTITVPGAEAYTITGAAVPDPNRPRTIIWTNPDYVAKNAEDAEWTSQFSIKNGYARAIAVYDAENNKLDPDAYINTQVQPDGSQSDEYGINNGFGWVSIRPGSRAVFEFIPDYGYQLTSIKLNEQEVDATGVTNQFEIVIPQGGGNVHFAAEFSKIDDVLKSGSESIEGGAIELPEGSIENGTAQLRVNDVELSADKIKGFEDAAGDFSVKTFLDIDLYQVFYKGKDDDEDVWESKLDELEKEATISLKLADGINADDIVIVHNVHDGEEYEVIQIESYDEATNTITFKTKSFSNYAIATKGEKEAAKIPKAGDSIIVIASVVGLAILGLCVAIKFKKK